MPISPKIHDAFNCSRWQNWICDFSLSFDSIWYAAYLLSLFQSNRTPRFGVIRDLMARRTFCVRRIVPGLSINESIPKSWPSAAVVIRTVHTATRSESPPFPGDFAQRIFTLIDCDHQIVRRAPRILKGNKQGVLLNLNLKTSRRARGDSLTNWLISWATN